MGDYYRYMMIIEMKNSKTNRLEIVIEGLNGCSW